jgi:hypothetical protein
LLSSAAWSSAFTPTTSCRPWARLAAPKLETTTVDFVSVCLTWSIQVAFVGGSRTNSRAVAALSDAVLGPGMVVVRP